MSALSTLLSTLASLYFWFREAMRLSRQEFSAFSCATCNIMVKHGKTKQKKHDYTSKTESTSLKTFFVLFSVGKWNDDRWFSL